MWDNKIAKSSKGLALGLEAKIASTQSYISHKKKKKKKKNFKYTNLYYINLNKKIIYNQTSGTL